MSERTGRLPELIGIRLAVKATRSHLAELEGTMGTSPLGQKERLCELKERLEMLLGDYLRKEEECVAELEEIKDGELSALLQWRYVSGLTWQEIAAQYPSNPTPDSIKKRFRRLMERHGGAV